MGVPNWEGAGDGEHRTVGPHRAWCHDDREWCYAGDDPYMWCECCCITNGYEKRWVKIDQEIPPALPG